MRAHTCVPCCVVCHVVGVGFDVSWSLCLCWWCHLALLLRFVSLSIFVFLPLFGGGIRGVVGWCAGGTSPTQQLDKYVIHGVGHNVPFLRDLCVHPRFVSGKLTTGFIEEEYPDGFSGVQLNQDQRLRLAATAAIMHTMRCVGWRVRV